MAPVEANIVSLMQQMAKMHQPLNISEGLSRANSLIEGTEREEKVGEFKSKRGWTPTLPMGRSMSWARSGTPVFEMPWPLSWKEKEQKFSKDRAEWSRHRNFIQMYDEVYNAMEQAGATEKSEQPIWVDKDQQPTNKENSFGQKATWDQTMWSLWMKLVAMLAKLEMEHTVESKNCGKRDRCNREHDDEW
jgi:hypothetical protein